MTLPTGQFWACRNVGEAIIFLTDAEPGSIAVFARRRWSYKGRRESMGENLFRHVFGGAPAPGEALLLDGKVWGYYCPDCDRPMRNEKDFMCGCECRLHTERTQWVRHAYVLDRRTLEDAR